MNDQFNEQETTMAVLVEAISVIIRLSAINEKFSGGWNTFLDCIPNQTLCYDDELARVGFMSPPDVKNFHQLLIDHGLTFVVDNKAIDFAVVDQQRGLTTECEWLEFAKLPFGEEDSKISACWFFDDPRVSYGIHLRSKDIPMTIAFPPGWNYEKSLSKESGFIPLGQVNDRLQFLRTENGLDILLDKRTGKEVTMGRTSRSDNGFCTGNKDQLTHLFVNNLIRLNTSVLFDTSISAKPHSFNFNKVEGMMLGLAVGDSLGNTSESLLPSERHARHGEITDYLFNRHIGDKIGLPSDDTQLAFWTLEQMLIDNEFIPDNVAKKFTENRIYGIGQTVSGFLRNYKAGEHWYRSGPKSAGNGALMRIAPIIIPHLRNGGTDLWVDTSLLAMMTHNDYASTSACVTFVSMLWELLDMNEPPHPDWWIDRYVDVASELEGNTNFSPRGGHFKNYKGPLWNYAKECVDWANREKLSVVDACNSWFSGAYLLETVPSVLLILNRYGHDPEQAIIRAVNDTKDNDTIAAIIGSAVGALHGKANLPERWLNGLIGRTTNNDDGKIFNLLAQAKETF